MRRQPQGHSRPGQVMLSWSLQDEQCFDNDALGSLAIGRTQLHATLRRPKSAQAQMLGGVHGSVPAPPLAPCYPHSVVWRATW